MSPAVPGIQLCPLPRRLDLPPALAPMKYCYFVFKPCLAMYPKLIDLVALSSASAFLRHVQHAPPLKSHLPGTLLRENLDFYQSLETSLARPLEETLTLLSVKSISLLVGGSHST